MDLTIGIVIPCYKPHIHKLPRLLESIEKQTQKPHKIVISCSSSQPSDISGLMIQSSVPLTFVFHNERKNASQNRNFGASIIKTDIISFFDADDVMHPQRCEAIMKASKNSDIILHSYTESGDFFNYTDFDIEYCKLKRAPSGCAVHIDNWRKLIHHSQVSVKSSVLNSVLFKEDPEFERKEDAIFCGDVLEAGFKNAYISNVLSKYEISGTWS